MVVPPKRVKSRITRSSSRSTHEHIPNRTATGIDREIYMTMFIAASFTVTKTWK